MWEDDLYNKEAGRARWRPARWWYYGTLLIGCVIGLLAKVPSVMGAQTYDLWEVYQLAKDFDAEHKQQWADIVSRRSGFEAAVSSLLPQVAIVGSVSKVDETSTIEGAPTELEIDGTNSRGALRVEQSVLDMNAFGEYKSAKVALTGLDAEAQALNQDFILRMVEAYLEVLSAQVDLDVSKEQERSFEKLLSNIKERHRAGVAPLTDVRDATARLDSARIDTIVANSNLEVAIDEIFLRTGRHIKWVPGLRGDLEISLPEPASPDDWYALAKANSPRLLLSETNLERANIQRKLARRAYIPRARLVGSYSTRKQDQGAINPPLDTTGSTIELNVEMPLFLGGSILKEIERTTMAWISAREAKLYEQRSLERDISSLYKLLANEIARVGAQERAVASSISALKSSQLGYKNGVRTVLDVQAAQQSVAQAKRNYARARHDYVRRYVALLVRAGVQDEQTLQEINGWFEQQK